VGRYKAPDKHKLNGVIFQYYGMNILSDYIMELYNIILILAVHAKEENE
jgi:hypothetical protein